MLTESLNIYVIDKDGNKVTFPNVEGMQPSIVDVNLNRERMAGAPTNTSTLMYPVCLDSYWTKKEFIEIGSERYYVKQVPTSEKNIEDTRYKHEITFVSERDILENVFFFDCVTQDSTSQISDKPRTNTTEFSFYGDLNELVQRLNDSLSYSKIYDPKGENGFCIVIDDDVEIGEAKEVSMTDAYFATAMQEIYNVFEVPYYWVGKICHVGYQENEITEPFEYGSGNGLISVQKTNAEFRLINRITGQGSADNIPYYYPNTDPNGEPILNIKNMDRANIKSIVLTTINKVFGGSAGKTFCLGNIREENATTELYNDDKTLNGIGKYAAPYLGEDEGGNYQSEDPVDYQEEQLPMILEFEFYAYVNDLIDMTELSINTSYEISGATTTIDFDKKKQAHWGTSMQTPIEGWDAAVQIIQPDGKDDEYITANDTTWKAKIEGIHKLIINCTPNYKVSMHPASKPGALSWATVDWYCNIRGSIKFKTLYGDIIYENGRISKIEKSGIEIINRDNLPKLDIVLQPNQDYGSFDAHIISGSIATCANFTIERVEFINPISKLMPSIYRDSKGTERFYNAISNKYQIEGEQGKHIFNNPYLPNEPLEGKQDFEDIKPTINGITNEDGELFGEIAAVAFDDTDSDDLSVDDASDANTNTAKPVHPYFYVKLHKFSGENGFNLFKQGLAQGAMTFNFITGSCAGCSFKVQVSEGKQVDNHYEFQNLVQVDDQGNIVAGDSGDKIKASNPIDSQQDTMTNSVWIALEKDNSTFGVLMPNATNNYRPQGKTELREGDKFVITNILLPTQYITAAEKRLEAALIKYMSENNDEKFTFSIKFSRIYLQEHPEIAEKINENTKLHVKYNNVDYPLFVSSYSRKSDDNILDEISVELSEKLTIAQNKSKEQMDSIMGNINEQINSAIQDNNNNTSQGVSVAEINSLKTLLGNKLSRVSDDSAKGIITFLQGLVSQGVITANGGIDFGQFITGLFGIGGRIDAKGHGELRSLRLWEWLEVPEIRFNKITVNIGLSIRSEGGGIIETAIPDVDAEGKQTATGSAYLKLEDGEYGAIAVDDLCMGIWHDFGGGNATENSDDKQGTIQIRGFKTIYFRVTDIPKTDPEGKDNSDQHFFRYQVRSSSNGGNDIHPVNMLHFAQRGNTSDTERQHIVFSTTKYTIKLHNLSTWNFSPSTIYDIDGVLDGFSMEQVGSDGQTYVKHFQGTGHVVGNAYIYGQIEKFERVGYRLIIEQSYNGSIAPSETETETCRVFNGYGEDVTYLFKNYSIVRDSGDAASDGVWNAQHTNLPISGVPFTFKISYDDLGIRSSTQISTMFTVTVSDEAEKATAEKSIIFN